MKYTSRGARLAFVTTACSAALTLAACQPEAGGSAPSAASDTSSGSSAPAGKSTSSSPASPENSGSSDGATQTMTGETTQRSIEVPADWKVFSRTDFKNPAKLQELANLLSTSVDSLTAALSDKVDAMAISPTKDHGTVDEIFLGTTGVSNAEGIPDEPAARTKASMNKATFVKFSYVTMAGDRGCQVETTMPARNDQTLTTEDFLVPGNSGNLDEVGINSVSAQRAHTYAETVTKTFTKE